MASAEAEIRHVFGATCLTEGSIGAAPPDIVKLSGLKIGYSRICACTKIPVFCLPPGPADENKGSRPSLIALQTELLLLYLNGVRRSELVVPNSNYSSSGAD